MLKIIIILSVLMILGFGMLASYGAGMNIITGTFVVLVIALNLLFGILKTIFTHPVKTFKILFYGFEKLIITVIKGISDPENRFVVFPVISIIISYILTRRFAAGIFSAVLIFAVSFLVEMFLLMLIVSGCLKSPMETLFLKICYLYQKATNDFHQAYGDTNSKKYYDMTPDEYVEWMRQSRGYKEYEDKTGECHVPTEFDLRYKEELMTLGLYMKDFTEEDLSKTRKELVKKYHPDNFTNERERKENEKKTQAVLESYDIISGALKGGVKAG